MAVWLFSYIVTFLCTGWGHMAKRCTKNVYLVFTLLPASCFIFYNVRIVCFAITWMSIIIFKKGFWVTTWLLCDCPNQSARLSLLGSQYPAKNWVNIIPADAEVYCVAKRPCYWLHKIDNWLSSKRKTVNTCDILMMSFPLPQMNLAHRRLNRHPNINDCVAEAHQMLIISIGRNNTESVICYTQYSVYIGTVLWYWHLWTSTALLTDTILGK